jgi:hypothetical protein
MSESMREEFEVWAITSAWLGLSSDCMEFVDGGYLNCEVQAAWLAWQASRAVLCVELPAWEQYDDDMVSGAAAAINDCRDAIHAAGVKTNER